MFTQTSNSWAKSFTCVMAACAFVASASFTQAEEKAEKKNPFAALELGVSAHKQGNTVEALGALEYAAQEGEPLAKWKLGQIYATGDGVEKDERRAFKLFSEIANEHGSTNPAGRNAPFVASAFVKLGKYFEQGLPKHGLTKDRKTAWKLYFTAGNVYHDPNALYHLYAMCESGEATKCSKRGAMKWLKLSAERGHVVAQARLGHILFEGSEGYSRQPVQGLKWLAIAHERTLHARNSVVSDLHESAFSVASIDQRRSATQLADNWMTQNCSDVLSC